MTATGGGNHAGPGWPKPRLSGREDSNRAAADATSGAGATGKRFASGGAQIADDAQFLLGERQLPSSRRSRIGDAEVPPANAPADQIRAVRRQNEAAQILADHGLDVQQLPNTGKPGANPDIAING